MNTSPTDSALSEHWLSSFTPRLRVVGCTTAAAALPGFGPADVMHAGPPLAPDTISDAMAGAVVGGLLFEGLAATPEEAVRALGAGNVTLLSCHEHSAVGALAGIITASTPVWVVESEDGRRAISPVHEGADRAIRSGQYTPDVLERLSWFRDVFSPVVSEAIASGPDIDPVAILASGLNRGDEGHNRNVANSAELLRILAPRIVEAAGTGERAVQVLAELSGNVQGFLPIGMATAKVIADTVQQQGPPGLVTAVAANGTDFGIRVSGVHDRWFTQPSEVQPLLPFPEFTEADANPIMGDSAIMETVGLGASALTAAPRLARSLGLDLAASARLVAGLRQICVAESTGFTIPLEDFRGSPGGVSVERVVRHGIRPRFSIGYLHREMGRGRVGVGMYTAPEGVFVEAAQYLRAIEEVPAQL